ncbi:TPA: hypothetical protein N0F65_010873 [Lagenidium giganteum]|uniref:Magnesium transport protein CorA n=1 Tax=Lagenidium giganteum TaxID=4803 RepID=A0AAV2YJK0_9STRA|nr:TPA: hypothetical protein N0F65_010873 [Lagenidium giganteum]
MDFYSVNEETPLLKPSSPTKSESEDTSTLFSSASSSLLSQNYRSTQTEVQLSVDKVSFIYSPKSPAHGNSFSQSSSDYNDDELSILDPYFDVTTARLRMAFDEAHPDGGLNLKRLAIKYRLHPLAIEDTLEMHERPKFDRYDGHLFLVFPVLRMEETQDKFSQLKRKRTRSHSVTNLLKIEMNREQSVDPDDEDPFKLWIEHVAIFVVGNSTVITVKDGDQSKIWSELNRRLTIPYSKLRHNDAKFLTYAVLDVIVDQITSVIDAVTENLMELEDQLESLKHHFDIGRLRFLKNELFRLPRLLKPAREVLKNLIESKDFDETVTAYIRDVHDHIVQVLDDIELQLQMCRLLTEDYRDAKANQMNYVIYTLTIVTTVFLPAQFLTGVYGMNFDNMPELHSRYGYALFWLFVLTIAVSLQLYFRYKKWI